jgi:hypothetical protein
LIARIQLFLNIQNWHNITIKQTTRVLLSGFADVFPNKQLEKARWKFKELERQTSNQRLTADQIELAIESKMIGGETTHEERGRHVQQKMSLVFVKLIRSVCFIVVKVDIKG